MGFSLEMFFVSLLVMIKEAEFACESHITLQDINDIKDFVIDQQKYAQECGHLPKARGSDNVV